MAFSAHEVLEESWNLSKRNYWAWWPVIIVAALVIGISQILAGLFTGWGSTVDGFFGALLAIIGALLSIIAALLSIQMALGILKNSYAVSGGERPSISRLFEVRHFWWFLFASLIFGVMVVIGLFALVVPGLIIAFMLGLFAYALIGGQASNGFSALATSWDRISSNFWKYLGFRIVLTGVIPALLIAGVFVLGLLGGGAFLGFDALSGNAAGGIIAVILGFIAVVIMVLLYVWAITFTVVADALAYRRLAPEWAE